MGNKPEVTGHTKRPAQKGPPLQRDFPIVGLGASAGGLEAFGAFFRNLPTDTGMAFVLVQHLDPSHASSMVDLLKRHTRMPVVEATHSIRIRPNYVYMIPPNKGMTIAGRNLQLAEQVNHPGIAHSIDMFFRSLAEELKENAIVIILSGTGSDGTLGAKAIKAGLGLVMVQEPETARYDGMPRAAIVAGVADLVVPAEKMAEKLIDYVRQSYGQAAGKRRQELEAANDVMQRIFALIHARTRHDFANYKPSTLKRRIERRMNVNQLESIEDYIRLLQENPQEMQTLVKDFLINVTSFFRDPEAFAALTAELKEMIERKIKEEEKILRVWVVGCSTGEEAYSLAIMLQESMDQLQEYLDWQIFATDLDPEAIEIARRGAYPENINAEVSPARLKKFFHTKGGRFTVNRETREKVIFSLHDITSSPPFSRIDLISARNILIYLNRKTQKKLIPLFHYSLNKGGILFLGTAETVDEFTDSFTVVDRKWKIYAVRKEGMRLPLEISPALPVPAYNAPHAEGNAYSATEIHEAEKDLLKALPPSVLIDELGHVLYVHGDTWKFLQLAEGKLTSSIVDMAREGIRATLVHAINDALAKGEKVAREGARTRLNGNILKVRITAKPVGMTPHNQQRKLAVIFEEVVEPKKRSQRGTVPEVEARVKELEQELHFTRENLHSTVEELETANEELRAANEEYQATNEELHSTNEEMETSRRNCSP